MVKVTVLGCGASGGLPLIGNVWGAANPANPKNTRTRPSIYIEAKDARVLVDTGPDMRQQLLRENVSHIDAVLYTHEHADHTHGIDDLRTISFLQGKATIPVYGEERCLSDLKARFGYLFEDRRRSAHASSPESFDPFLKAHAVLPGEAFKIKELTIRPFLQNHGRINSLGFRVGDFAYSTDVVHLEEAAFKALQGVKVWIVDCLRYDPNPSHSHLQQTLDWIERVQPEQAYLTHMGYDMDYDTLCSELPSHVRPAYDGMKLEI